MPIFQLRLLAIRVSGPFFVRIQMEINNKNKQDGFDAEFDESNLTDEDYELPEDDPWAEGEYGYGMLGEDRWEDEPGYQAILAKMPKGWCIVKCTDFDWRDLTRMEKWLSSNCRDHFKRVGFASDCSTKVAVTFASEVDAIMFKLRWR
jgi:hypothetical protein